MNSASASGFASASRLTTSTVHHVGDGELDDLPALRTRDVRHLYHHGRYVARRGVAADLVADLGPKLVVEVFAVAERHEQDDPHVVAPLLSDREALEHAVDLLHLAVDLRRSDAYAAGIQHRVRPPVDDHPVVLGDLREVSVAPDAGVLVEVCGAVARAVVGAEEAEGHGGEGAAAHELPFLAARRPSGVVEDGDVHSERQGLDLAAPHRRRRVAADETRHDVRPTGHGAQAQVAADLLVYEIEALGCEGGARREHAAHGAEVVTLRGLDARLRGSVDEFRRHAEDVHPRRICEVEQHVGVGVEGRSVVEHQRRFGGERADEPVPHHPAAGREVEDSFARLQVDVESVLLQMLEKRAPGAVDDALRRAGRSR